MFGNWNVDPLDMGTFKKLWKEEKQSTTSKSEGRRKRE